VRHSTFEVRTLLVAFALLVVAGDARADWLLTPFVGSGFGTTTTHILLEPGAEKSSHLTIGGSAAILSRAIFGAEADFGYSSHFFEKDTKAGIFTGSTVATLSGSVLAAVPLSITRESLRPYVVAGLGLLHGAAMDSADVFSFDDNLVGLNVGGGAIGLLSPRTGFRFEIRQFRALKNGTNGLTGRETTRLSFWRASVGLTFRFAR
jgi:opacity protein-like surface antigen